MPRKIEVVKRTRKVWAVLVDGVDFGIEPSRYQAERAAGWVEAFLSYQDYLPAEMVKKVYDRLRVKTNEE